MPMKNIVLYLASSNTTPSLALTCSIASVAISIPINRRFSFAAATAVVPPPRNGSKICMSSIVSLEIIYLL